jgi:hypothetical protein
VCKKGVLEVRENLVMETMKVKENLKRVFDSVMSMKKLVKEKLIFLVKLKPKV